MALRPGLVTEPSRIRPERRYVSPPILRAFRKGLLAVNLRLPVAVSAALAVLALLAPSALGASNTVVISQIEFRGPTGGNDEIVRLRKVSATAQDISGWQLWGNTGTTPRASVPTSTTLPPGKAYLFTNVQANPTPAGGGSYSGAVAGDTTYTSGFGDTGGVQLRNAAGLVMDAVGSSAAPAAFREGAGLTLPTANGD